MFYVLDWVGGRKVLKPKVKDNFFQIFNLPFRTLKLVLTSQKKDFTTAPENGFLETPRKKLSKEHTLVYTGSNLATISIAANLQGNNNNQSIVNYTQYTE